VPLCSYLHNFALRRRRDMSSAASGPTFAVRKRKKRAPLFKQLRRQSDFPFCLSRLGFQHQSITSFHPIFTSSQLIGSAVTKPQIMAVCIISQYPGSFGWRCGDGKNLK
jgi:hypothetical protein